MNLKIFNDFDAMSTQATDEICAELAQNPKLMLCMAAGHTSIGVLERLCQAFQEGKADFSAAWFVAMDEWLGMSEQTSESCGSFLRENFLNKVNFAPDHIRLFNGLAADPLEECADVEQFIRKNSQHGVIDSLVLGAGINGHLALNEPGTSFSSRAHVTALDPVTQQVGQKYFHAHTPLTGGLTLGIANFREARHNILLISGDQKKAILQKILSAPITTQIPATAIREFENASLYCDSAAAALLDEI